MNKYEVHEIILKQVCKEIDQIAEQMQKSSSMSSSDLERLDKMFHLKKSMLTCKTMEESEEYEGGWASEEGNSERRGRAANGRYISREMGNSQRQSFAEGYSEGYSEAMNQMNGGNSGHYPIMPTKYPRW